MNRLITHYSILSAIGIFGFTACDKADSDQLGPGKDLILTATELERAGNDNLFTFELFRTATADLNSDENALLSPLSISMALAMTNSGAAGETRKTIENVLKFGSLTTEEINGYYQKLIADLPALDPKTTLEIANSIWHHRDFSVFPDFKEINRAIYKAEVAALDFNDPNASNVINDWVSNKTKEKIPTIIDGPIPAAAVMYLINALYFKGAWEQRFDTANTQKREFRRPDASPLNTDFMQIEHTFNISATEDVEAIELPYGNKKYSMVVLKPRGERTPSQVAEKLMETGTWNALISGFQPRKAQLALPKFKFSYENELKNELTDMGMGIAFIRGLADFSGISSEPLYINRVLHKTFVEVNEEGTEAAAVTAVEMNTYSSAPSVYPFLVDRPFLFAIREMETGLILFLGQVNDPSVEETESREF